MCRAFSALDLRSVRSAGGDTVELQIGLTNQEAGMIPTVRQLCRGLSLREDGASPETGSFLSGAASS